MAQNLFYLNEQTDQQLLSVLNLQEKGSDCIIIHPGSHSIKFGLGSMQQPFIAPNVIAYPTKNGRKILGQQSPETEEQRQFMFDTQIEKVLPEIEHTLRKKRFLLIDAKSAKNIRNKQVSYKIFEDTNSINEYNENDESFDPKKELNPFNPDINIPQESFSFTNVGENQNGNGRFFVGKEAQALYKSEEYIIRYPIKYGDLNISQNYNIHDCIQDLQNILETLIWKYMRIPKKNIENFNCILVIPDIFVKHHLRYIVSMILGKMRFKSLFMHNESVMATYAMALPSACIVDVGSSKVNVCCVDEGLIVPKSIVRKHYGGDDLNEVLYRFVNRNKALHYFPRNLLDMDYHYHRLLIEQIKEQFCVSEMDSGEIVKTCNLYLKERTVKKQKRCTQVTFNCSDSLLFAPQSIFYTQMISVIKKIKQETSPEYYGDPLMIAEGFQDPEDIIHDILQGINAQTASSGINQNAQQTAKFFNQKPEESPGQTPSGSLAQDNQSDIGEDSDNQVGEKVISNYQRMQDPMDLDEMICRSICTMESGEARRKMANSIILIGGTTKIKKFVDSLEEAVMDRFTSQFDESIERVNVEQFNVQQHQQFQQQQILLQAQGLASDTNPDQLRIDPRFVSWIGASIIPKLESSKDMFISREKFLIDFKPFKDQYNEFKSQQVQATLEGMKNDQEEKKGGGNEDITMLDQSQSGVAAKGQNPEEQLNQQQLEQIEKEVNRKLKKERTLDAGVKNLREKVPFHY